MTLRLVSCALAALHIAACVQDDGLMSEGKAENGVSAGVEASIPSPRGTTTHDEPRRFPEAFDTCNGEAVQRWVGREFSATSKVA